MTRIFHFSDVHYPAVFPAGLDKRLFGYANSMIFRRSVHKMEYMRQAVGYILKFAEREPVDAVLFTGDAVSTSDPEEFAGVLPYFQPLLDSGIPLLSVPGNHDCYVKNKSCRTGMESFYASLGGNLTASCYRIGNIRILLLPEAKPTPPWLSCGYVSDEALELVRDEMEKKDTAPLVIAGHFPVTVNTWRRGLRNADPVRQGLADGRIALSLCGHIHKAVEFENEIVASSLTLTGLISEIIWTDDGTYFLKRHSVAGG